MSGKYTWKLVVTAVAIIWAVLNLVPVSDTPFQDFVRERATGGTEWQAIYDKAKARVDSGQDKTFYVALRSVAEADKIDLTKFFPFLNIESSLSMRKKNGIALEALLKRSRGKVQYGLDLAGGVSFTLEMAPARPSEAGATTHQDSLADAIRIIGDRVDALGVAEPLIRPVGENRIIVQLAGVSTKDNPDIINVLKKPARLEFKRVHPTLRPEMVTSTDEIPPDYVEMLYEGESQGKAFEERLFVKRRADMTGKMVDNAAAVPDQFGAPYIQLNLTNEGADVFGQLTTEVYQQSQGSGRVAIILDGKIQSAPRVDEPITGGRASITGGFTDREAIELANVLNNPLDRELNLVETAEIGATLAEDAVSSGLKAFIIGTAITVVFIAIYYTTAGLLAVIAMAVNVLIILGVMCSEAVGATMSLPGIAGIVLTLAMSVDSNILIFERMREELAVGKNLRASLEAGFEKAFSAIFDGNVTTLITAAIMMWLGTGPVKGFGVTLTIGIFSTMFAALIVSRLLLELVVFAGGVQKIKFLSLVPETKFDFMKWAKPSFIASWTIVLAGIVVVFVKGDAIYGIDFRGGDELTVSYERRIELTEVDAVAQALGITEVNRSYATPLGGGQETLKIQTPFERGASLLAKLQETHPEAGIQSLGISAIGPSIGDEIKWNAFLSIGLSLVGILLYVAFRFEVGYGVGAVVSLVHVVVMTIGVFVMLGRQFNAVMVGAILLIVGYAINDTIVVFDRIREELKLNPNARLRDVINLALNKTLARTVITGGTTFATAITLAVVAGGAINDLAVTLIIGLITGTFSSVFIASPIFFWWHKGDRKHVEESHDITPKYEWSATSKAAE
jgi:SecD/SecF fusion protein